MPTRAAAPSRRETRTCAGGLEAGLQADLTVLSGNIRTTPPEALTSLRVTQTWVGGRQAYAG